jgi:hypothetical protein
MTYVLNQDKLTRCVAILDAALKAWKAR